jgi:hypothetical protein
MGIKKAAWSEAAYYEISSYQRNRHAGFCQIWHEVVAVVRGVITMIAFPEPCASKNQILTEAHAEDSKRALDGGFVIRRNKTRAAASWAWRDHGLLFHVKILIDVLALNAQLARAMAIGARRADESAGFVTVECAHAWLLLATL